MEIKFNRYLTRNKHNLISWGDAIYDVEYYINGWAASAGLNNKDQYIVSGSTVQKELDSEQEYAELMTKHHDTLKWLD